VQTNVPVTVGSALDLHVEPPEVRHGAARVVARVDRVALQDLRADTMTSRMIWSLGPAGGSVATGIGVGTGGAGGLDWAPANVVAARARTRPDVAIKGRRIARSQRGSDRVGFR